MLKHSIALLLAGAAFAQPALATPEYPTKPIRLIVTVPPGAGSDLLARTLAPKLGERLGRQIVVDNRAGGSGVIGMDLVAKAPADGYTLVQGTTSTLAINPVLMNGLPYDPQRDFAPISMIDDSVMLLVAHPSVGVKDIKSLIALAKSKPGQITYASTGPGSMQHLVAHMFASASGIDLVHVPYKGSAPAFVDLAAGHVQLAFSGIISAEPYLKAGKLIGLAVTASRRTEPVTYLPTLKEAGGPDIHASFWNGILAPAKTPRAIVERLNREIVAVLASPDYVATIKSRGGTPVTSTPEQLGQRMKVESTKYAKAVKESGARPD
jgi:tripartite-type tricarboxylate transporter receptor subunit TctC